MNIRIIINSLIIIFILHIIILNINQTYTFGKKNNVENFEDKNSDNTLSFLTNDDSDSSSSMSSSQQDEPSVSSSENKKQKRKFLSCK